MNGESIDIKQTRLQRLKELFPELFTENQLDWEKLKATFGDDINFVNERYVLNWAGKSDAFRILQQPTTATLKPVPEESVNFDTTENLFIEGENLEVLKVLQKAYYGKVKCIIIDPPYNTGSDSFIYPDRFSEKKEDYLKRIGDKDEEGYLMKEGLFRKNSKDSGHFHSNWLSMMYPRLFLAKNLLRDDGVIFVHIDDNEVHNLRMVMNEIFGEENFVGAIVWRKKEGGGQTDDFFVTEHEYVLTYRKTDKFIWGDEEIDDNECNYTKEDKAGKFKVVKLAKWGSGARKEDRPTMHFPLVSPDGKEVFPIAPDGNAGRWRVGKQRMEQLIKNKLIYWEKQQDKWIAYEKIYFDPEKTKKIKFRSILYNIASTGDGTNQLKNLFGVKDIFQNPKPMEVISSFMENNSADDDIILDFFSGSGTTAQAVLELNKEDGGNRKFILVQLPEQCDENSEAYKAGYKTIADIAKERIRRVIKRIKENTPSSHSRENGNPESLFKDKNMDSRLQTAGMTKKDTGNGGEIASSQTPRNDNSLDLGFKVFKLTPSSFKIWRGSEIDSEEKLTQQLDAFTNPTKPGAEKQNMLYELMLKAGYEITSHVQYVIAVSRSPEQSEGEAKQSHKGNKIASGSKNPRNDTSIGFYSINNNELIIALDAVNEKLMEQIIAAKPQKVITLDSLFTGNDQLKTNTVLQMRDAGVDFKTI